MALTIVYVVECAHCGGDATSRTLHFDQPEQDGTVTIDVELSIGQHSFTCEDCGCEMFTGDIEVHHDDGSCRGGPSGLDDKAVLCDGCDRCDETHPVSASNDGRGQFCTACLPVANRA